MPPEDVGDTVGQDPTQGSRLRPKTEQVLPGGSILNPPATGSRLQPVTSEVTKQLITSCCSRICCSPESFVTKSFWRPSRTQHKMHRRMQFRSNTLRIEHTSPHSLERTHRPSPALALLHLAGGLSRRRRLYAPAALRAADVLFMRRRPYAPPTRD